MSKYDFSRLQRLISKYHNLQIKREIKKKELKTTRKNIYNQLLIKNTDTAQLIILKMLFFWVSNGNLERISTAVATLPSGWGIKPGDFLPQLVIVYRIENNSKTGNYDITIPHYNGVRTPLVTGYKKGPHRVALILTDGSQIIINASSEGEGKRVIKQLRRYVSSKFLTDDIRYTKNQRVRTDSMVPTRADYYPNGQNSSTPLWRHYF